MARILYGVHGTGHGHAMRGLTIARAMPEHDFLFACGDDAPAVLSPEFPVEQIPNLGTAFRNYKVDFGETARRAGRLFMRRKEHMRRLQEIIERFKPDICMVDLEYFVPRAARRAGIPCLTLDHQHVITCCRHDLPRDMLLDAWLQGLSPRFLFPPTEANIIISFYEAPLRSGWNGFVAPPILRESVLRRTAENGDHILVYQSNSTDARLISWLEKSTGREVHVFGYGDEEGRRGNINFHKKSEKEFLDLLASCAYVIQGGSHTLMSEALYFGKPVLSLPIRAMVEQRFNAYYLQKLGYGKQAGMEELVPFFLEDFETRLPQFRESLRGASFCGNSQVFAAIDHFAATGKLPSFAGNRATKQ